MTLSNMAIRFLILVLLCSSALLGWAQQQEDPLQSLDELKDPFMSQLPPPKVIPKPEIQVVRPPPVEVVKQEPVSYSQNVPVVPIAQKAPNVDSFVIKGLVWNTDIPQAIVNDKVVKVGDELNGIKITAIRQEGVEFTNNGIKVLLKNFDQKGVVTEKP